MQVCSACTELKGPATEYVRYFNFPPEVKASIKSPPLSVLLAYRQQCMANAPDKVCLDSLSILHVCEVSSAACPGSVSLNEQAFQHVLSAMHLTLVSA